MATVRPILYINSSILWKRGVGEISFIHTPNFLLAHQRNKAQVVPQHKKYTIMTNCQRTALCKHAAQSKQLTQNDLGNCLKVCQFVICKL